MKAFLVVWLAGLASCKPNLSETKIVGGTEAKTPPFYAAIASNADGDSTCGGTFISKRVVLTAAHCVDEATFPIRITQGLSRIPSKGRFLSAYKVVIHPAYNRQTTKNDIALIYLYDYPEADFKIKPITVHHNLDGPLPKGKVIGLGNLSNYGQVYTDQLFKARVKPVPRSSCLTHYPEVTAEQICAVGQKELGFSTDTCQGDSGGPVYFEDQGKVIQYGIVSYGLGCANEDVPGIYTRVASYANWIRETSARLEQDDLDDTSDDTPATLDRLFRERCYDAHTKDSANGIFFFSIARSFEPDNSSHFGKSLYDCSIDPLKEEFLGIVTGGDGLIYANLLRHKKTFSAILKPRLKIKHACAQPSGEMRYRIYQEGDFIDAMVSLGDQDYFAEHDKAAPATGAALATCQNGDQSKVTLYKTPDSI